MRVEQLRWTDEEVWSTVNSDLRGGEQPALVLVFASPKHIHNEGALNQLRSRYPDAVIAGGSTAGNVIGTSSSDSDIAATAIAFDHGRVRLTSVLIEPSTNVSEIAQAAVEHLLEEDLRHVFVLSDGLNVNGSELAKGLNKRVDVTVSGGLMGDNGAFAHTYVIANGPPKANQIALIGFYGEQLSVTHGCFAGWEEFGINRVVTRSSGNIVYEIDDQPALALYKKYLGDAAAGLPGSGLRFPLSIRSDTDQMLIRTLLSVDEENQSLTFAGDVPEGATTLLMKGSTDNLIDGAEHAANQAQRGKNRCELAVIISCVGRRMVMDQMADEELEVIYETLGENTRLAGFYSYGELSPQGDEFVKCSLHNQTMTLFTLSEA
ncbi:MAG: FIST N-terminal domain-containing protein [Burkholderiaceae bacterium]